MAFSKTPPPKTIIYGGGLDLVTPPTKVAGGRLLIVKNWIADTSDGYREWDGFTRVDGQTDPVDGEFIAITMDSTSGFVVDEDVSQATTGAVGVILQIEAEGLYLVAVTGAAFLDTFLITGATSSATGTATSDGFAGITLNDGDSINDVRFAKEIYYRDLIAKPPGEGNTDAFHHQSLRVAVRNASGGASADLFKSSSSGWVQITLGHIVFFNTLANTPDPGTVLSDGAGNSATVHRIGLTAVGSTVGYATLTGFTTGFAISAVMDFNGGATTFATVTVAPAANTLSPSGKYEWLAKNFRANDADSFLIYGANGLDNAFELDAVNDVFSPILTDQTSAATIASDTPKYLTAYRNHLFLGYEAGMTRNSLPGNPYLWDAAAGSQENPTGAPMTGFDSTNKVLLIYTKRQTLQLTGKTAQSTTEPFAVDTASTKTGGRDYTVQQIGTTYSLDDRGIIDINRVDVFGDLDNATISKRIQPLVTAFKDDIIASVVIGRDNMLILFKANGEAITVTFMEDGAVAFSQLDLGIGIHSVSNGEDANGSERILVGSTDGFAYELLKGRSFDGVAAERWFRPVFHHLGSVGIRKRWKRAFFNTLVDGIATLQLAWEFGFGSVEQAEHVPDDAPTHGINSLWDIAQYELAIYDASIVSNAYSDCKGHGDSIGLIVYHNSATDDLVTFKDVTYEYKIGSLQRGAR